MAWLMHNKKKTDFETRMRYTEGIPIPAKVTARNSETVTVIEDNDNVPTTYQYERYSMVVEFLNTKGETVVREYPDNRTHALRNSNNNNNNNNNNNEDADEDATFTVYHHPDYPESAFFSYNTNPTTPPSCWNIVCLVVFLQGAFALIYAVSIVATYSDFDYGLLNSTIWLLCGLPVIVLCASKRASTTYQAHENEILYNTRYRNKAKRKAREQIGTDVRGARIRGPWHNQFSTIGPND